MDWGKAFSSAYDAATDVAKTVADTTMSSARDASGAVRRVAQAASQKAVDATKVLGNVAGFSARTVASVPGAAGAVAKFAVTEPYRQAAKALAPKAPPLAAAIVPCQNSWVAKKARIEKRNQLIAYGAGSPDPKVQAAAARLKQNNDAVELAKLSFDSYAQYPGGANSERDRFNYPDGSVPAPEGWRVVPASELETKGIPIDAMEDARAVVYQTPEDWPGGQKTVLAFRGTADTADVLVDYDQAMSQPTSQYKGAVKAGSYVADAYPNALMTGHSLGGGKAQAAGAVNGRGGTMFNSAGLNPVTVDGCMPSSTQFQQYRTTGDPLTGSQNSPLLQVAVAAIAAGVAMPLGALGKGLGALSSVFSGRPSESALMDYADKAMKAFPRGMTNLFKTGNILPPAIGPVHEVLAVADDGSEASTVNVLKQHSMVSVVNGIEKQKSEDLAIITA